MYIDNELVLKAALLTLRRVASSLSKISTLLGEIDEDQVKAMCRTAENSVNSIISAVLMRLGR